MDFLTEMMDRVEGCREELVQHRRYLHENPETGFDVDNTVAYIRECLKEKEIDMLPSSVGVIGRIRGGKAAAGVKAAGLRADMDALSLQEINQVPYCSKRPGKMHACGHDGHTAMLLTAAGVLKEFEGELARDVILMFQPAEEGPQPGGAKPMLEEMEKLGIASHIGVFGGLHLTTEYPLGTVAVKYGSLMASTDEFYLKIKGKGGHAGTPHQTVDALSVAAKFVTEMESFMSRKMDPFDPAIFSVGILRSGSAINIVSETAELGATIRCQSEQNRAYVLENAEKIIRGICSYTGASYELEIKRGLPVLVNDETTTKSAERIAAQVVGSGNIIHKKTSEMGAEDFSYVAERFPAAFLWLGARNEEKGFVNLMHNPGFDFDEDALLTGAKLHCRFAVEL